MGYAERLNPNSIWNKKRAKFSIIIPNEPPIPPHNNLWDKIKEKWKRLHQKIKRK